MLIFKFYNALLYSVNIPFYNAHSVFIYCYTYDHMMLMHYFYNLLCILYFDPDAWDISFFLYGHMCRVWENKEKNVAVH